MMTRIASALHQDEAKGGNDKVLLNMSGFRPLSVSHLTSVVDLSLRVFQLKGSHFFLNKNFLICLTFSK